MIALSVTFGASSPRGGATGVSVKLFVDPETAGRCPHWQRLLDEKSIDEAGDGAGERACPEKPENAGDCTGSAKKNDSAGTKVMVCVFEGLSGEDLQTANH